MNKFEAVCSDDYQMLPVVGERGGLYSEVPCLEGGGLYSEVSYLEEGWARGSNASWVMGPCGQIDTHE